MREIKFRVFDYTHNKMIYDGVFGGTLNETTLAMDCDRINNCSYPYHNAELMQFTGLKDKNGKEIYEGDIVKNATMADYQNWQIVYRIDKEFVGFLPYEIKFLDDKVYSPLSRFTNWKDLIVIGNIYENPEKLSNPILTDSKDSEHIIK